MKRILVLSCLLLWCAEFFFSDWAQAQSRFYLTLEKSFSPTESPQVRLDFTNSKAPLVLRVLKPKNAEQFLEGQINVSRSYEEPLADINPAHYLLKGINEVESPLPLIRNALSLDFRDGFGGNEFNDALKEAPKAKLVTPPIEVQVGPPKDFEVVREVYIDLQKGGEIPQGLYDEWMGDEGRFQVRTLEIDPLSDGLYLLQAVQNKHEAQALLQVSALSVQAKQSTSQLLLRVIDRKGIPVANAQASIRDGRGKWAQLDTKSSADGELRFETPASAIDGKLLIQVKSPSNERAFVSTDFLPAVANEPGVFLLTDRPIFKPGDSFSYKGILRTTDAGQLKVPEKLPASADVKLYRSDGTDTGLQQEAKLTEFGSLSGTFEIPSSTTPGLYKVVATMDSKAYAGELRIKDYVKPTFYLELFERDDTLVPGSPFHFKVKAKRYAGGVPSRVKYEVSVYKKKFEAPQFVVEGGGNLEAGHDYFGAVKSMAPLTQPQRVYSSVEARFAENSALADYENPWSTAELLDDQGEAEIEVDIPNVSDKEKESDWIYSVVIRAQDAYGAAANLSESIPVTLSEAIPAIQFLQPVALPSESQIKLLVRATYPDERPAPQAEGKIELKFERPDHASESIQALNFKTEDNGFTTVTIQKPQGPGKLSARARLVSLNGKTFSRASYSESSRILVVGKEGERILKTTQVELATASTILSPGEGSKVFANFPDSWGSSNSGPVWETLAGSKVFETKSHQLKGSSHWFEVNAKPEYGTGFFQTISVPLPQGKFSEQTIGFRIVPVDKRVTIKVNPRSENAEPLLPFQIDFEVSDYQSKPLPNVELAVQVVDRAVYAVQSEFRPPIFDFFYPLPRLNVASFYSDELQGYGYADELKKPNFRLAAIKTQTQPFKRNMRDTAAWFPHVVTDAQGKATVNFTMPANLTEWQITAVASDKEGRVGEGQGRFRSQTDIGIELEFPQFLRDGDKVTGAIGTQNSTDSEATITLNPVLQGGLQGVSATNKVQVPPKGKTDTPISLSTQAGFNSGIVKIELPQSSVKAGGAREFEVGLMPATIEQTIYKRGYVSDLGTQVPFSLPSSGVSSEVKVRVLSGAFGAVLSAARELVSYPYGCTEQLAHTTLPNLVLLNLVKQGKLGPDELKVLNLEKEVQLAKVQAEQGIKKLIGNQKSEGGFSLWPSESEPNAVVSIIALRTLKLAFELEIPLASGSYQRGRTWIENQLSSMALTPGTELNDFSLGILSEFNIYSNELDDISVNFIQKAADATQSPKLGDMVTALQIINKRGNQYWFKDKIKDPNAKSVIASNLITAMPVLNTPDYYSQVSVDFETLGFGYGKAAVIARVLGVLDESGQLPIETKEFWMKKIMEELNGGWWNSTFESAEVVYNLKPVINREIEEFAKSKETPRVLAVTFENEKANRKLESFPGGYFGIFPVSSPNIKNVGVVGAKPNDYVSVSLKAKIPFGQVQVSSSGLAVKRTLLKVTAQGAVPLGSSDVLHQGDIVVSKVNLLRSPSGPSRRAASKFVVVEDGIPSFAEVIDEDRTYLADANVIPSDDTYWVSVKDTQRFPDKTVRVLEIKPGAGTDLYQVWRVRFTGDSGIPPVRAFDMYNEEIFGNSSAQQLKAGK